MKAWVAKLSNIQGICFLSTDHRDILRLLLAATFKLPSKFKTLSDKYNK